MGLAARNLSWEVPVRVPVRVPVALRERKSLRRVSLARGAAIVAALVEGRGAVWA